MVDTLVRRYVPRDAGRQLAVRGNSEVICSIELVHNIGANGIFLPTSPLAEYFYVHRAVNDRIWIGVFDGAGERDGHAGNGACNARRHIHLHGTEVVSDTRGDHMARYQVTEQRWAVGPYVIPPGTVLDTADWEWEGLALPRPPPIDAVVCLDQAAYNEMVEHYELYEFRILTSPNADVDRRGNQ